MDRIAVVMGKYTPGGIKSVIMNYYRHIDKNRYQFDLFVYNDSPDTDYLEIESLGGRVFEIPNIKNIIGFVITLIKMFRQNKYNIVHGYLNTLNLFVMLSAKLAGVPIRIAENLSTAHPGEKKTLIKNILKFFSTLFATDLAANSLYAARWIYGKQAKNAFIINNALDLNKYTYNESERLSIRNKYGVGNKFVVGHIGRFSYQKNHDFLIDIFYELALKDERAILMLVGYGELEEYIKDKVNKLGLNEKVIFVGKTENLSGYYNAMDCFVLPSFYEGLPVVGIEAQSFDLPCIFSKEITDEVAITDKCLFIELKQSPVVWADSIFKIKKTKRINNNDLIRNAGYDLRIEVEKLMTYYDDLKKHHLN